MMIYFFSLGLMFFIWRFSNQKLFVPWRSEVEFTTSLFKEKNIQRTNTENFHAPTNYKDPNALSSLPKKIQFNNYKVKTTFSFAMLTRNGPYLSCRRDEAAILPYPP